MAGLSYVIGDGSGFIGSALTEALRNRGDRVTWIYRTTGVDRMSWQALAEQGLPACDGGGQPGGNAYPRPEAALESG